MLRLPAFTYAAPESVEEVLAALAERPGRARLLAGGTDLLPNLKHGIEEADVVVSLQRVPGLSQARELGRRLARARRDAHPRGAGRPTRSSRGATRRWRARPASWPGRTTAAWARSAATSA
jgi:hypothetical protein